MANGAFKFKDNSGNVVSFISGSGPNISFSGGTLDLSGMTGLTLGNLTLSGTTQNALSASHAASYLLTSSFNTYSGTTDTVIGTLQTSTSSLNSFTSSATTRLNSIETSTGSLNSYTSSNTTNINAIHTSTGSLNTFTSSATTRLDNIETSTSSLNTFTSSATTRLNSIEGVSGSYATTGSNVFIGDQIITGSICSNGNIVTTGQIVAQTINVQQVTSSIVYSCGSNVFGTDINNTQQFTGSILTSGSLCVNGFVNIQTNNAALFILDSTPFASCVGGKISLQGNYRSVGDITEGGHIKASKTNSTDGDYGFDLIFANHTNNSTVSEKMRISSTGNVGIGLSSRVCQRLTILDNNDAEGLGVFRNFSSASDAGTYIKLGALNGSNVPTVGAEILGVLEAGKTSGYLTFRTYCASAGQNRMTITSGGNVGINMTSPQTLLHIIKGLGNDVISIGEADSNIRLAIGQEAGYTGNYINSRNIDLKLQSYLASGSGGNLYFQTANDGTNNVSTRLHIGSAGIACFACQVCAPSFRGGSIVGTSVTVATDCSGVIVDVAGRHGLMKYVNYSTGLVGACSGTDSNIATWMGRFAGSISAPTAVYQDLMINGNGNVTIGTSCAAFGRSLTAFSDIVAYYSNQESITMGLSAGTGQQSWGIQVCDTGDGGSALHLNARGGNVGINKGSGNVASHALDVTGVINSTDRVQAPQIVAAVQKFSSTSANTFYTSSGGIGTFNIDIAGTTGLAIAGNYQTAEITFQAGLYPGSTTIIGKILVVNRGGAFSCSFYTSSGVGGVGTIGVVPYSNASNTFGVCLTSDCTSSAVYWSAIVNAMSV